MGETTAKRREIWNENMEQCKLATIRVTVMFWGCLQLC